MTKIRLSFLQIEKNKALFLKMTTYGILYTILAISAKKMHFLRYFSYTNVLKISPNLRLTVLINCLLIKKKVCNIFHLLEGQVWYPPTKLQIRQKEINQTSSSHIYSFCPQKLKMSQKKCFDLKSARECQADI